MTAIKKAAASLQTTTATTLHNATEFIADCENTTSAKAGFGLNPSANACATDSKRFAMLKVQFAKHGHTLTLSGTGTGGYLAERWGMARHLPTLDDAEQFLIQIGGAHDRHE